MGKIKISRSKIELFLECPRCFWLEMKHNIKRPEGIKTAYIGSKYDPLLKSTFDEFRLKKEKPPELQDLPYDFQLFDNIEKLNLWRTRGVEFSDPQDDLVYFGKIDDLLLLNKSYLVPFDYKTTLSKEFVVHNSYKNQLGIYGYLLKKLGEKVSNIGVLYVVKVGFDENFSKIEERKAVVVEDLDYSYYDEVLEELKRVYYSSKEPEPSAKCEFCQRDSFIKKLQC